MKMKIAVVGGGASGLVAAIYAKTKGNEVIILERNKTCGKKILMTGNGRCNYWNQHFTSNFFHTHEKETLEKIISKDNQEDSQHPCQSSMQTFMHTHVCTRTHTTYMYRC